MPNGALLVTGFEPFGGAAVNASGAAALRLHGQAIGGRAVVGLQLPCVFGAAPAQLLRAIDALQPSLVLCLGLAPSRSGFWPERVAINLDDARIADNQGAQPTDQPVIDGAPAAYFSTLPVKAMVAALRRDARPAELSHSAGTYVCNHLFFHLMHQLSTRGGLGDELRGGFMHVGADLTPDDVAQGVRVALAEALDGSANRLIVGGAID